MSPNQGSDPNSGSSGYNSASNSSDSYGEWGTDPNGTWGQTSAAGGEQAWSSMETNPWEQANNGNYGNNGAANPASAVGAGAGAGVGQQYAQGYAQPYGQPAAVASNGGNGGNGGGNALTVAVIVLAIIAVLMLVGGLSYFYFTGNNGPSNNAAPASASSTMKKQESSASTVTSTTEQRRAENFSAPSSWKECSGSGDPGDLNLVYAQDVGGNTTTCSFATNVRNAFVEYYQSTQKLSGTVKATSPATGKTYTMTCNDNGDYVTCTGGTNATVHIV